MEHEQIFATCLRVCLELIGGVSEHAARRWVPDRETQLPRGRVCSFPPVAFTQLGELACLSSVVGSLFVLNMDTHRSGTGQRWLDRNVARALVIE